MAVKIRKRYQYSSRLGLRRMTLWNAEQPRAASFRRVPMVIAWIRLFTLAPFELKTWVYLNLFGFSRSFRSRQFR